jgi:hypothetical protein
MAREVIVRTWCDPCLADDKHEEGDEFGPMSLIPGKPRVVALCEVHRKELYDPLIELLTDHGQPVDSDGNSSPGVRGHHKPRATNATGPTCPACGHVSTTRTALQAHTRKMHEASLGVLEGKAPSVHTCPECQREFDTPQGMGAHRRAVHDVRGANASPVPPGGASHRTKMPKAGG